MPKGRSQPGQQPCPGWLALSAAAVLLIGGYPSAARAQDRSLFETKTAKVCMQTELARQRAGSEPAVSDAALTAYCSCYAAELALTMPADVLNTSASAATPEQAAALLQFAQRASDACRKPAPSNAPASK